jgi:hypothetical protein
MMGDVKKVALQRGQFIDSPFDPGSFLTQFSPADEA